MTVHTGVRVENSPKTALYPDPLRPTPASDRAAGAAAQRSDRASAYLMPTEAARLLGVTSRTLSRWAHRGLLPCLTTPGGHRRYRTADIEALRQKLRVR